jgi:hypothetical protein
MTLLSKSFFLESRNCGSRTATGLLSFAWPKESRQRKGHPECREATLCSSGFGARARIRDNPVADARRPHPCGRPFGLLPKPSGARVRAIRGSKAPIWFLVFMRYHFVPHSRHLKSGHAVLPNQRPRFPTIVPSKTSTADTRLHKQRAKRCIQRRQGQMGVLLPVWRKSAAHWILGRAPKGSRPGMGATLARDRMSRVSARAPKSNERRIRFLRHPGSPFFWYLFFGATKKRYLPWVNHPQVDFQNRRRRFLRVMGRKNARELRRAP